MSSQKNTTTGRALSMASIGAGIAGSYVAYLLQRAFLGEAKGKIKLKSTHIRAARRMADEMQALRGPAMKLGQMLSLQTGVLPDEVLTELATLQMEAPGMHPSLVRVQVKASLGREPEEIFKHFTMEPFAAASLGQVHHAITHDGQRVAVKVQYPGIRQAIETDFSLVRTVSKPAQASGHISKAAIDEVEALHADPHWGNYLFNDDASISLVDFGCVKYLSSETVAYLRSVFLYPGSTGSADFRRLLETYYERAGEKLLPGARRALLGFVDNFYRKVYPPKPEKHQLFDFSDATFLRDFLRESKNLVRTMGVLTEFIFMGRTEMGLYQTLHRLKARVPTSQIVKKYL